MHNGAGLHDFSAPTILRRIRPEHNERRFYALAVTADLFGNIVLLRNWGRIGTGGKQRGDLHPDYTSAATTLERLAGRKRRRGYLDWDLCRGSAPNTARP
jgi:predicted DNA-binding WGR domain protein